MICHRISLVVLSIGGRISSSLGSGVALSGESSSPSFNNLRSETDFVFEKLASTSSCESKALIAAILFMCRVKVNAPFASWTFSSKSSCSIPTTLGSADLEPQLYCRPSLRCWYIYFVTFLCQHTL